MKAGIKLIMKDPILAAKLALHKNDPFPVLVQEAIEAARVKEGKKVAK